MENLFFKVIDLSVDASFIILFVLLVRVLLKRFPKIFSYVLWSVVFLRLVFSFSIESPLSIMGVRDSMIQNIKTESVEYTPSTTVENYSINETKNVNFERENILETEQAVAKKSIGFKEIIPFVWAFGIGILVIHSIYSTGKLYKKLKDSEYLGENIYINKNIETAFVFGLINPKIYRPYGLSSQEEEYILEHERVHLKREDHIWKFLAFFITVIHWFNPLVWISYYLMGVDMELSCDEAVVRKLGSNIKRDYSASLLSFSTGKRILTASPIAFGENNVKSRIKNILKYRKPKFWVLGICLILVLGTIVGCLTDSKNEPKVKTKEYYLDEHMKGVVSIYEDYGVKIEDYEVINFEKVNTFEHIMDVPLEIWELAYKLKPKNLEKARNKFDGIYEDGWLIRNDSDSFHYLLFSGEEDHLEFYGNMPAYGHFRTYVVEGNIRDYLENIGKIPKESYGGDHLIYKYEDSSGYIYKILMSKPIRQDDSGIWVGERRIDSFGNIHTWGYKGEEIMETHKYFQNLQKKVDNGEEEWRRDPRKAAIDYIYNVSGGPINENSLELLSESTLEEFYKVPESVHLGYFMEIFLDDEDIGDRIHIDNVEWLTLEDEKRLKDLGIDSEKEMPNGFYINNPTSYPNTIFLKENTVYKVLNPKDISGEKLTMTKEEFAFDIMSKSHKPLLKVTSIAGDALEIEEVYLP